MSTQRPHEKASMPAQAQHIHKSTPQEATVRRLRQYMSEHNDTHPAFASPLVQSSLRPPCTDNCLRRARAKIAATKAHHGQAARRPAEKRTTVDAAHAHVANPYTWVAQPPNEVPIRTNGGAVRRAPDLGQMIYSPTCAARGAKATKHRASGLDPKWHLGG